MSFTRFPAHIQRHQHPVRMKRGFRFDRLAPLHQLCDCYHLLFTSRLVKLSARWFRSRSFFLRHASKEKDGQVIHIFAVFSANRRSSRNV
jgi:hypothetical protein